MWIVWKTYPHLLWISLLLKRGNVDNVENLSTSIVDKLKDEKMKKLSTEIVDK